MDYVNFTLGFLFLVFTLISLVLGRLGSLKSVSLLLAAAGGAGMVYYWLLFLQLLFPPSPFIGWMIAISALIFTTLFFWTGLRMTVARTSWKQAVGLSVPFILLFATLQWAGPRFPPVQAAGLSFLFPGLGLIGFAMFRLAGHYGRDLAAVFRLGGISFFLWAAFILARLGNPAVDPVNAFGNPSLQALVLVEVLAVSLVVLFLWRLLRTAARNSGFEWAENLWTRVFGSRSLALVLAVILAGGFLLVEYLSFREQRARMEQLGHQLLFFGASLFFDAEDVQNDVTKWELKRESMQELERRLAQILAIVPGLTDLTLIGDKGSGIPQKILQKNQPQVSPLGVGGEALTEEITELWEVLTEENPVQWSIHPERGLMDVEAMVLLPTDPALGRAALVFSFDGRTWMRILVRHRLPGFFTITFLLIVAVGSFLAAEGFGASGRRELAARARLELALEGAGMATWEWSPTTGLLMADRRWNRLLGLGEEEQISSVDELLRLVPASHRDELAQNFALVTAGHIRELEMDFPLQPPGQGAIRWLQIKARLSEAQDEEGTRVLSGTLQSVQERHRLSEEVTESRERYRSLFQFSPLGVILVDRNNGSFLEVNPAFCQILGYSMVELMTTTLWDLMRATERKRNRDLARGLSPKQGFGPVETHLSNRQGQSVAVLLQGVHYPARDGRPCLLVTVQDVRLVKAAERELARSQEIHRTVIENLEEIVFQTDVQGRWTFLNKAWQKTTGYAPMETVGRSILEFLDPAEAPTFAQIFTELKEGRRSEIKSSTFFRTKDNARRLFQTSIRLLEDPSGETIGAAGILRDITKERSDMRILEAVASINSILIGTRLEGDGWQEPLELLGQATSVSRVYIFHHHVDTNTGRLVMSQIAEWNSGNAEPQRDNPDLKNIDYQRSGFFTWLDTLRQGKEINSLVRDLPAPQREHLQAQQILSILIVPIFAGADYWGFVGFDECRSERVWEPGELALLRSAAGAIGLRLSRQKDEDALFEATNLARQAAAQADEANRAKSTFLATMSHEIRTPLNAVIGLGSLLQETKLSLQQADYVRTMVAAGNTLLDLISDILDYSKIESGKMEIAREPFDLEKLVLEPLRLMSRPAEEKGLNLCYCLSPVCPRMLIGDRLRLQQILLNLLSNGVKFTERGQVSLVVDCAGTPDGRWNLKFRLGDTGVGIAPDALQRLFSPFQQADSSITRRFGGTGLGLAISRRLAEVMHGDIEVRSEVGKGTEFVFTIPLPQAAEGGPRKSFAPGAGPLNGKKCLVLTKCATKATHFRQWLEFCGAEVMTDACAGDPAGSLDHTDFVFLDTGNPNWKTHPLWKNRQKQADQSRPPPNVLFLISSNPAALQGINWEALNARYWPEFLTFEEMVTLLTAPGKGPRRNLLPAAAESRKDDNAGSFRVLVAEDHPHNQKVISYLLRKAGCEPVLASNGREALEKFAQDSFDLVILDLQMPVMDGLTAVREMKKLHKSEILPTVFMALTANAFSEDREICLSAGFDRYAAKPITATQLREILAEIRRSRDSSHERHTERSD